MEFEIERQIKLLDVGETPKQETRGWDENKQVTFSQRSKEEAHDYRYFPEPDIPPIEIQMTSNKLQDTKNAISLDEIRARLPELPEAKINRFVQQFQITEYDAQVLTEEKEIADWYEASVNSLTNKSLAKKTANWVVTEILGKIKNYELRIEELKIEPAQLAKIVEFVETGKISRDSGKELLEMSSRTEAYWPASKKIEDIIQEKGFEKVSDAGAIEGIVQKVVDSNPKSVADYKAGKEAALQFLIGMVMKESKGKADVKVAREILIKLLNDL